MVSKGIASLLLVSLVFGGSVGCILAAKPAYDQMKGSDDAEAATDEEEEEEQKQ